MRIYSGNHGNSHVLYGGNGDDPPKDARQPLRLDKVQLVKAVGVALVVEDNPALMEKINRLSRRARWGLGKWDRKTGFRRNES